MDPVHQSQSSNCITELDCGFKQERNWVVCVVFCLDFRIQTTEEYQICADGASSGGYYICVDLRCCVNLGRKSLASLIVVRDVA